MHSFFGKFRQEACENPGANVLYSWVYSSLQPSSQTQGHATYNANAADAAQGETWEIQYGDGSGASGDVYTGTVEIGGVTATSQAIEAATSVSTQFQQDTNNDGLVGLAFSTINQVQPQPQQTFFDNIKGQLESPLFTAALKDDAAGSYDFGFIDNSKYTGQITYADVDNSNGFWEFEADGYSVGSGSSSSTPFNAILDTGTSLMYLPTAAVEAYYSQVSGAQMNTQQGGYTFDCSATLPDASVTVGGTQFTVPGSLINYAETGDGSCFGGLQDAAGLPYMIFGDVFLKATFAVFDSQGPRIGLAPQSGVSSNATGGGSSTSSPSSTLSSSPLLPSSTGSSPFSLPSSTGSSPSLPSSTGTGSGHHHHHGGSGTGTQDGGDSGSDPFAGIFGSEGGIGDDSSLSDLIGELMDGDSAQSSKRKVPTRLGRPAAVASSKS